MLKKQKEDREFEEKQAAEILADFATRPKWKFKFGVMRSVFNKVLKEFLKKKCHNFASSIQLVIFRTVVDSVLLGMISAIISFRCTFNTFLSDFVVFKI